MARVNGCAESCATSKHNLTHIDLLRYHSHYSTLPSAAAKKQWLLDYFIMNSSPTSEVSYFICGKSVCQTLWIAALGISSAHFYRVRSMFRQGHKSVITHSNSKNPLLKTNEALAWMEGFFDLMGERMPDRATVHLPSCLSKLSIYHRLEEEMKERGRSNTISQSQFFSLWKSHFTRVTIPTVSNKYSTCRLSSR